MNINETRRRIENKCYHHDQTWWLELHHRVEKSFIPGKLDKKTIEGKYWKRERNRNNRLFMLLFRQRWFELTIKRRDQVESDTHPKLWESNWDDGVSLLCHVFAATLELSKLDQFSALYSNDKSRILREKTKQCSREWNEEVTSDFVCARRSLTTGWALTLAMKLLDFRLADRVGKSHIVDKLNNIQLIMYHYDFIDDKMR